MIRRLLRLVPPGTLPVGAGLALVGLASYVHLAVAGHTLTPGDYSSLSVLWSIVFTVGIGVFLPVEQEVARLVSARRTRGLPPGPVLARGPPSPPPCWPCSCWPSPPPRTPSPTASSTATGPWWPPCPGLWSPWRWPTPPGGPLRAGTVPLVRQPTRARRRAAHRRGRRAGHGRGRLPGRVRPGAGRRAAAGGRPDRPAGDPRPRRRHPVALATAAARPGPAHRLQPVVAGRGQRRRDQRTVAGPGRHRHRRRPAVGAGAGPHPAVRLRLDAGRPAARPVHRRRHRRRGSLRHPAAPRPGDRHRPGGRRRPADPAARAVARAGPVRRAGDPRPRRLRLAGPGHPGLPVGHGARPGVAGPRPAPGAGAGLDPRGGRAGRRDPGPLPVALRVELGYTVGSLVVAAVMVALLRRRRDSRPHPPVAVPLSATTPGGTR